ncbi:hypothetical protein CLAFUR0_20047, partial [Fulvia fulva]
MGDRAMAFVHILCIVDLHGQCEGLPPGSSRGRCMSCCWSSPRCTESARPMANTVCDNRSLLLGGQPLSRRSLCRNVCP